MTSRQMKRADTTKALPHHPRIKLQALSPPDSAVGTQANTVPGQCLKRRFRLMLQPDSHGVGNVMRHRERVIIRLHAGAIIWM